MCIKDRAQESVNVLQVGSECRGKVALGLWSRPLTGYRSCHLHGDGYLDGETRQIPWSLERPGWVFYMRMTIEPGLDTLGIHFEGKEKCVHFILKKKKTLMNN